MKRNLTWNEATRTCMTDDQDTSYMYDAEFLNWLVQIRQDTILPVSACVCGAVSVKRKHSNSTPSEMALTLCDALQRVVRIINCIGCVCAPCIWMRCPGFRGDDDSPTFGVVYTGVVKEEYQSIPELVQPP